MWTRGGRRSDWGGIVRRKAMFTHIALSCHSAQKADVNDEVAASHPSLWTIL